jgi:hypothetical protein
MLGYDAGCMWFHYLFSISYSHSRSNILVLFRLNFVLQLQKITHLHTFVICVV